MTATKKTKEIRYTFTEWEQKFLPSAAAAEKGVQDEADVVSQRLISDVSAVLRKTLKKRSAAPAAA